MAEVRLEGLRKRFDGPDIVRGLTVTVRDGEFFAVVGPSGCGKSTLLHLLAGLESPTGGRILFDGRDVTALAPQHRDVALVFQSYALYPHMTVEENLAFPLRVGPRRGRLDRAGIAGEVRRIAELLGLTDLLDRRPRELSGGQRQRVALGRALIRKPRVFLLDEPLSNLDARLRTGMRTELRRLHDQLKITMIYVTHDQTEAMTLADRVAVLHDGTLEQLGTPKELYDAPANVFVAGFIGQPAMNMIDAVVHGGILAADPFRIPLPADWPHRVEGSALTLGIRPEHIRVSRPSGRAGSGMIADGTVRLVERGGGHPWVTLEPASGRATGRMLVALLDSGQELRAGDAVTISIGDAVVHFFNPVTGARIGGRRVGPGERPG
ncbi:MAG TPA: ABC transporter ATP-binding protein [Nitrospira sp.]|nr:ABC transporter ATP-binding protein [Nitrospira sp.]